MCEEVSPQCVVTVSCRLLSLHYSILTLPPSSDFSSLFWPHIYQCVGGDDGAGDKRTVSEVGDFCLCAKRHAATARKVQVSQSEDNRHVRCITKKCPITFKKTYTYMEICLDEKFMRFFTKAKTQAEILETNR